MASERGSVLRRCVRLWVGWVARHPWLVVFVCAALVVWAARYTAQNLGVNTNTADMISPDLEWRVRYREFQASFPSLKDNLTVVVTAPTVDDVEAAATRLKAAIEADTSDTFEWVFAPAGDLFFKRNGLLYLSLDELERTAERLIEVQPFLGYIADQPDTARLVELLREMRSGERDVGTHATPLIAALEQSLSGVLEGTRERVAWRELMASSPATDNDRRKLLIVRARLDFSSLFPAGPAIKRIREIAAEFEPGVIVRITGAKAMSHEELKTVSSGMGFAGLAALIMVSLVLLFGLRSVRLALTIIVTLIVGLVWTAAYAAAVVGDLNLISVAFAVLYIGLGVDYAIHFSLRYRELLSIGRGSLAALRETSGDVGVSLVLCAVTTGIGFLTFVPTDFDGVSELGIISAGGMFISLAASLTLLPALIRLVGPREVAPRTEKFAALLKQPFGFNKAMVAACIVGVGAAAVAWHVRFDHNPVNLRDAKTESVATYLDLVAGSDAPPWTLSVLTTSDRATPTRAALDAVNEVAGTVSLATYIPRDQADKLAIIDDLSLTLGTALTEVPADTRSPADAARLKQAIRAYLATTASDAGLWQTLDDTLKRAEPRLSEDTGELLAAQLQQAWLGHFERQLADLRLAMQADEVSMSDLPAALRTRWVSADGRWRVQVKPAENLHDNDALARFVGAVHAVVPEATGTPEVNLGASTVVTAAFQQALITALVIVAALLWWLTRRLDDTLFVLLPLILAGLITIAAMVAIGIPFNFANVICLPLLLGIGVDNGVHMVHRARAAPPAAGQSILQTSTARGVVLSALTTVCGFGNLAYSSHPGTASMGQVLTLGLALSVVCTLVLLPALLSRSSK